MATRKAPSPKPVAARPVKRGTGSKPAAPIAKPKQHKGGGADPKAVMERLELAIPEAFCELNHQSAWQLLIATILSAQSTDKTVNAVTPELFRRWPKPADLADAPQEDVEQVIKRTGFFRNKAKSIRGTAQAIVSSHGGQVPRSLDELVKLPGVARKTANVVLGTAYGIPSGFVVDTHVTRVAGRLGLTQQQEPAKIEVDLCAQFPKERWVDMAHRVLLHGRYTCLAKKPICIGCPLNELCPSRETKPEGSWQERAKFEAERVTQGRAG